jgi:beta-mannosidase
MKKSIIAILFLTFVLFISVSANGVNNKMKWEVGFHKEKNEKPKEWYEAKVPGAVQLDYAKANSWDSHMFAENWKDYRWMEDVYWTYKTKFSNPTVSNDEMYFFISKGIDYKFEIFLNGEKIFTQEGMFKYVELDLTNKLEEENLLEVLLFPVPKISGLPDDRQQAAQSTKPAVSYLWDWHPRLIPSGIWDDTFFEIRKKEHFKDVYVDYHLSENYDWASINLEIEGTDIADINYKWNLIEPSGTIVINENGIVSDLSAKTFELKNPRLWWTHDHGEPNLYISKLELFDSSDNKLDEQIQKIGFRKIQLVMHKGAWDKPNTFPKGRSNPPITLELNGRIIFGKGSNWVNPDIFPGVITHERYNGLLENAVKANFNILRVWGGGIVNKESFYDLCDEKGILVWTEFPLACNNYVGTDLYLNVLKQESEAIIKRIRKHPSNAIWSGGNELFNSWSGMTDQSLALRLLNSMCYQLNPSTSFIPTSPIMGMGHGHYVFRDVDTHEEVFSWMSRSSATAYTEFGMPGSASVELLKKIIPEEELFPPKEGTSWESHHAFKAWMGDTWLMKDMLTDYFGEAKDLEELVERSQWVQSEGYKCIFEEARRQKPKCSMALNWCYNEPWITAANNSLISYPNIPKPAFEAVTNSCRPFLVSARIPKFSWIEGETFYFDVFILNDLYSDIPHGKVIIKLIADNKEMELLKWEFEEASPNENIVGPTVRGVLPSWDTDNFTLVLEIEGIEKYSSTYKLHYKPIRREFESNKAKKMNQ